MATLIQCSECGAMNDPYEGDGTCTECGAYITDEYEEKPKYF